MTVYIILLIIVFTSGYIIKANKDLQRRKIYLFFSFTCILLVMALRKYTVGTDLAILYSKYYPQFENVPWNALQTVTMSGDWEIGFCAFNKLLCLISTDVQVFIIFSSIVSVIPFALFIYRNSEDVVFSTTFFITYNIMMISMNIVRQSMAIGIILLGMESLKKKKYIKFFIYVIVAACFHTTAIVALTYIAIDLIKFRKSTIIKLGIIFVAVAVGYRYILSKLLSVTSLSFLYGIYSENNVHMAGYLTTNSIMQFMFPVIFFVLCYVYWRVKPSNGKLPLKPKKANGFRVKIGGRIIFCSKNNSDMGQWSESFLILTTFAVALLRFFAFLVNVLSRLSFYFVPFLLVVPPHTSNKITNKRTRLIISIGINLLSIVYFLYIGYERAGNLWGVVPYEFFWQ